MSPYSKEICIEKGTGCYVFDNHGKKYLDLTGGIATCSIGHNNPDLVAEISLQASKIIGPSNLFFSEPELKLAEKLCNLTGLDKCFFSNSGTEAIEAAIKLVRKHSQKKNIIVMKGGFHGRTLGSLSATWNPKYRKKFEPLLPGFIHVEFGDAEHIKKAIDDDTAAVMIEPILGEAGVIIPPSGYLKEVETICKTYQILLIFDETQTGNGRTGRYFCYQHENVKPDIVTTAKGLAGGLPIGVTIAKKGIDFEKGEHGSTFGGNSLCCSASLKTIEIIESLLPEVEYKGNYFLSKLKSMKTPYIKDMRGKGL